MAKKVSSTTGSRKNGLKPQKNWQQEGDNLWWLPAGTPVVVKNQTIPDGMIYVGDVRAPRSTLPELSEIDPSLPIGWAADLRPPLPAGVSLLPYYELLPSARTAYLRWLASGRKRRDVTISFVYLFFTGLESRVLRKLKENKRADDLPAIRRETDRLLTVYGDDPLLKQQATSLLKLLAYLEGTREQDWQLSWEKQPSPGEKTYLPASRRHQPLHYREQQGTGSAPVKPATPPERRARKEEPAKTITLPVEQPAGKTARPEPAALPNDVPGIKKPTVISAGQPSEKPQEEAARSESVPARSDFLDLNRLATVQDDARRADALLADLYNDEDDEETEEAPSSSVVALAESKPVPTDAEADNPALPELEPTRRLFLTALVTGQEWSRADVTALARRHGLMVDAALSEINEYALDLVDMELLDEDGDVVRVDPEVLAELRERGAMPDPAERRTPEAGKPRPAASENVLPPSTTTPSGADQSQKTSWIDAGETVYVQGRKITVGLVYVGASDGDNRRAALVNPILPAEVTLAKPFSGHHGKGYHQVFPDTRGRYLDWLAADRRGTLSNDTPLFLFLYGLEQRVLCDILPGRAPTSGLTDIRAELDRLISEYRVMRRFRQRARALRAVVGYLARGNNDDPGEPPSPKDPYDSVPDELRYGLGALKAQNRQIPVDWALSWAVHHEQVRPPLALRTSEDFHEAFRKRFTEKFPGGLPVPFSGGKTFAWSYQPANPDLDTVRIPVAEVDDISGLTLPLNHLGSVVRAALADVEDAGKKTRVPQTPASPLTRPVAKPAGTATASRWSTWHAPGTTVRIGRYTIPEGMVYTGYAPAETDNVQWASAIDLSQERDETVTDPSGKIAQEVTGYADLTAGQRAQYLVWLSNRNVKGLIPGVFARLFRNGLERRIVESVRAPREGLAQVPPKLREELEKPYLLHWVDAKFAAQTRKLTTLVDLTEGRHPRRPHAPSRYSPKSGTPPFNFRLTLGLLAQEGQFPSAEWALEWVLYHLRPDDPERYRKLAPFWNYRLPYRFDPDTVAKVPEIEYVYQASCPGLGEVRFPVRGVPDVAQLPPPEDLIRRVREICEGTAPRRPAAVAVTGGERPTVVDWTTPRTAEAPREPAAPPAKASEPAAQHVKTVRDFADLAAQLAALDGPLTVEHRLAVARAIETLVDLAEEEWQKLYLHEYVSTARKAPITLCRSLAELPLRDREKIGDLLLGVAESGGKITDDQTSFLLGAHRILGQEAVFRLRLSYRGIAPQPEKTALGAVDVDVFLLNVKPPAETTESVNGLDQRHAALLIDLATRERWSPADVARLARWYGMDMYEAIDEINEAALDLTGTAVINEREDHVTVRTVIFEEMTQ